MPEPKRLIRNVVLFLLCSCALLSWLVVDQLIELRDWLDSDSWQATQSSYFNYHGKTSTVTYRYLVNDQSYEGHRVFFFEPISYDPHRQTHTWIQAHRGAEQVTVYYDPHAPERAVLSRQVEAAPFIQLGIGLLYFCVVGLFTVAYFSFSVWFLYKTVAKLRSLYNFRL